MVQYARIDAHYLLYIANCLIFELKQQDNGMPYMVCVYSSFLVFSIQLVGVEPEED